MPAVICPHDPVTRLGLAIGMYHCPDCGLMVVAGFPHPAIERDAEGEFQYAITEEDWGQIDRLCPGPHHADSA
jgi:hypothetical protein